MIKAVAQLPAAPRRTHSAGRQRADRNLRAWCAEMIRNCDKHDALMKPSWDADEDAPPDVFRAICAMTPRLHELRGRIGDARALTPEALLGKAKAILADYRWNVPEDRSDAAFVAWSLARDLVAAVEAGAAFGAPSSSDPPSAEEG